MMSLCRTGAQTLVKGKVIDKDNVRTGYVFGHWEAWVNTLNVLNRYYSVLATRSTYGYSYNLGAPRELTIGILWRL